MWQHVQWADIEIVLKYRINEEADAEIELFTGRL